MNYALKTRLLYVVWAVPRSNGTIKVGVTNASGRNIISHICKTKEDAQAMIDAMIEVFS